MHRPGIHRQLQIHRPAGTGWFPGQGFGQKGVYKESIGLISQVNVDNFMSSERKHQLKYRRELSQRLLWKQKSKFYHLKVFYSQVRPWVSILCIENLKTLLNIPKNCS